MYARYVREDANHTRHLPQRKLLGIHLHLDGEVQKSRNNICWLASCNIFQTGGGGGAVIRGLCAYLD